MAQADMKCVCLKNAWAALTRYNHTRVRDGKHARHVALELPNKHCARRAAESKKQGRSHRAVWLQYANRARRLWPCEG